MSTDPPKRPFRLRTIPVWLAVLLAAPAATAQTPGDGDSVTPRAVASYRIEVELDTATKVVSGHQIVFWRNVTANPARELQFHLYLNAFKNNRSTFAKEAGEPLWDVDGEIPDDYWGHIEIESMEWQVDGKPVPGQILRAQHIQPDDGNPDDETVLRVELAEPVPPEGLANLKIVFKSKLPRGIARTGWVDGYYFAGQWFPKLGVLRDAGWDCRQYHANTEYFADFGNYDVTIRVPAGYVVAGTGSFGMRDEPDGSSTYRFSAKNVHDFAWVASDRLEVRPPVRFNEAGLPPVNLRLYLLPEHESLGDRYLVAARIALRRFGEWFGPYPYPDLTIVDPPYNSDTGGMEYPTLITGGTSFLSPKEKLSPETVTVHEVGHQWWYGMVASNEFEEAWLDEGINSWAEARALKSAYPPAFDQREYLGGLPIVFKAMPLPFETLSLPPVRRFGKLAPMNQPSWLTTDSRVYQANSYAKPEVVLWTLERLLGEERMMGAMRDYFQRHAYRHPTTADFVASLNESVGEDLGWFFNETFFSSELVDYAVDSAKSSRIPPIAGRRPAGSLEDDADSDDPTPTYLTEVLVRRLEGAKLPVEALLVFEDGSQVRETWDGQSRWWKIKRESSSRLRYAAVDPDRKILLDVDPVNNTRLAEHLEDEPSPALAKWGSKWLFWVQNLLETFAFLG